jgi:hypothetical protein
MTPLPPLALGALTKCARLLFSRGRRTPFDRLEDNLRRLSEITIGSLVDILLEEHPGFIPVHDCAYYTRTFDDDFRLSPGVKVRTHGSRRW